VPDERGDPEKRSQLLMSCDDDDDAGPRLGYRSCCSRFRFRTFGCGQIHLARSRTSRKHSRPQLRTGPLGEPAYHPSRESPESP